MYFNIQSSRYIQNQSDTRQHPHKNIKISNEQSISIIAVIVVITSIFWLLYFAKSRDFNIPVTLYQRYHRPSTSDHAAIVPHENAPPVKIDIFKELLIHFSFNESKTDNNNKMEVPRMLINAGLRSSGTTELNTLMKNEFGTNTICLKSGLHGCGEGHYWDDTKCVLVHSNTHQFDNRSDENGSYISITVQTNLPRCSVANYVRQFRASQKLNGQNLSFTNDEDVVFFEKSPRYYLYPHIPAIFSKHILFANFVQLNSF